MKKTNLLLFALIALCMICILNGCGDTPSDTSDNNIEDGPKMFDVTDTFFTFESYDVITMGPTKTGSQFSLFTTNMLEIYGTCLTSLDEVSAVINLYDDKGKLVGTYRASKKEDISANDSFVLSVEISDNVRDSFCVVTVDYSGITDSRDVYRVESFTYNVTYVYNNGQPPQMVLLNWHTYLSPPKVPQKDGYDFKGWYTDPECTQLFDFTNTMPSDDMVLYADYALDYETMGQMLLATSTAATVKITTKSYTSLVMGLIEINSHTKVGEGVIIKGGSGYYYILTTEDLIAKKEGYESVSYTIEDYYGNTYTANHKHSSDGYNLGVLYFEKGDKILSPVTISATSPSVSDKIAIVNYYESGLSFPNFGDVLAYEHITHSLIGSEAGDIRFDMMIHNAMTDVQITGRPVFNMDLELVGIQCGTISDKAVGYENSHVIPLEAIKKYIDAYGL